jgi:signal transduction histidine kinase
VKLLLDQSLLQKKMLQLDYHVCEIAREISKTLKLMDFQLRAKKVRIKFWNWLKGATHFKIDRNSIAQVLTNLITNAYKFSSEGSIVEVILE